MIIFSSRSLVLAGLLIGLTGAASAQDTPDQAGAGYSDGYNGPMGPNVSKAFGVDEDNTPARPAPMQQAPRSQPGVISDPQQVRDCLCMQTHYEMLSNDVSAKQGAYSQAKTQVSTLQDQISAARANPSSPQQIEQIRQMSQQRIDAQNQLNMRYIPELQKSTKTYNRAVSSFQSMCGGKSYDTEVLARVKTGLVCQGG